MVPLALLIWVIPGQFPLHLSQNQGWVLELSLEQMSARSMVATERVHWLNFRPVPSPEGVESSGQSR